MTSYVHIALVTVSVVAQSAALNPHAHCSGSQTKSLPPPPDDEHLCEIPDVRCDASAAVLTSL
ncbi:hypothetical protein PF005_g21910 [Phytophthora fragariae]|uniref:Uncharacterized protein n=1 Tax=Phytophthora fragariae TaxID=53985 RepID=A0A6A3QQY1_9STRA|nr:hypothetical protein PF003_g34874 [Phytophthora fragariae]KAE8931298.1 hypothetical protein PF009_g18642 [Phytophthora fragariae]KAE8983150.1 hypothetical protein PF011_g21313 [Phytophthora fragariae]KAE9081448.1 hypothetical protein PF007_g22654 [Phytophthora fragariae]KAE9104890.1 hypothetical protein PF006_g21792 [Phytophthora fragariae]